MTSRRKAKQARRELGLVLARHLLGLDDLHYGLWDADLEVCPGNFPVAQQRYSDMLLALLPPITDPAAPPLVLDVGCGTGHLAAQMLERGYRVEAVSPDDALADIAEARIAPWHARGARIHRGTFESVDLPSVRYDCLLFSESFQYLDMTTVFDRMAGLLRPGGVAIVCDFFRTPAHGDGGPGDRAFGGGHDWTEFQSRLAAAPFAVIRDDDITARIAPNVALLQGLLEQRLVPAAAAVDGYLAAHHPRGRWLLGRLFGRRLARFRYKYLSGVRTPEAFARYKTYRCLVLRHISGIAGR